MLPSGLKDVLQMIEERVVFGRTIVQVIVYMLPVAIVAVIAAAIITGAKAIQSVLPNAPRIDISLREWVSFGVTVAAFVVSAVFLRRRLKKLETVAANEDLRQRINTLEEDLVQGLKTQVSALSGRANKANEQIEFITTLAVPHLNGSIALLDKRVDYLESQVGDEILSAQIEAHLSQRGLAQGQVQRVVTALPAQEPRTKAEEGRLAGARELLREVAAIARQAEDPGNDVDKVARQDRFIRLMQQFISEHFTFSVSKRFRDFLRDRNASMKPYGRRASTQNQLVAMADYFEELANQLTIDDIDEKAQLPSRFGEFAKGN